MKKLAFLFVGFLFSASALAQEFLPVEAYAPCELFVEKANYDEDERLAQIKELGGEEVTVYIVKGKQNKVKLKYTGVVDYSVTNSGQLSMKFLPGTLSVSVIGEDGLNKIYLPRTNDKSFRIYRTRCLENE